MNAKNRLKGILRKDKVTKKLFSRLKPGSIVLLDHPDLDEVAAEGLLRCRVKGVINAQPFMTGRYPNKGPSALLARGVLLLEIDRDVFDKLNDGEVIKIAGEEIYQKGERIASGRIVSNEDILAKSALVDLAGLLDGFVENTLEYAKKEKDIILGKIQMPDLKTDIEGRHVLVVVRGRNYYEDLKAILHYIEEEKPVIIGVDGGADALLEFGLIPDIIIGDMDSVSDGAMKRGKEIVLHAYPDGRAPGEEKCREHKLAYTVFPCPGTSEDIALLLAYEKKAKLIVALGTHTNMIDFLEKGRPGMASTFLIRLKVGSSLVDAKGVSLLYTGKHKGKSLLLILLAAILPAAVIFSLSPVMQHFIRLLVLRLKLIF